MDIIGVIQSIDSKASSMDGLSSLQKKDGNSSQLLFGINTQSCVLELLDNNSFNININKQNVINLNPYEVNIDTLLTNTINTILTSDILTITSNTVIFNEYVNILGGTNYPSLNEYGNNVLNHVTINSLNVSNVSIFNNNVTILSNINSLNNVLFNNVNINSDLNLNNNIILNNVSILSNININNLLINLGNSNLNNMNVHNNTITNDIINLFQFYW